MMGDWGRQAREGWLPVGEATGRHQWCQPARNAASSPHPLSSVRGKKIEEKIRTIQKMRLKKSNQKFPRTIMRVYMLWKKKPTIFGVVPA